MHPIRIDFTEREIEIVCRALVEWAGALDREDSAVVEAEWRKAGISGAFEASKECDEILDRIHAALLRI